MLTSIWPEMEKVALHPDAEGTVNLCGTYMEKYDCVNEYNPEQTGKHNFHNFYLAGNPTARSTTGNNATFPISDRIEVHYINNVMKLMYSEGAISSSSLFIDCFT